MGRLEKTVCKQKYRERVLGIRSSEYDGILKDFGELEKRGEVPEWNDIVKLGKGESAVNEYWIKPADSSEYRLLTKDVIIWIKTEMMFL